MSCAGVGIKKREDVVTQMLPIESSEDRVLRMQARSAILEKLGGLTHGLMLGKESDALRGEGALDQQGGVEACWSNLR